MKTQSSSSASRTLYCFSPAVMLGTFAIEIMLAAYVLLRYKMDRRGQLVAAILVCLAAFQAAEYLVCTAPAPSLAVSRAGFVAITMLPALGLHLACVLGRRTTALVPAAYASAAAFVGYFSLAPRSIYEAVCGGNYVIFSMGQLANDLYSLYYFSLLLVGAALAFILARGAKENASSLRWLGIGYLTFMVPTGIANAVRPETIAGIPSIMCGFAVMLALVLALRIAPEALAPRAALASPRPRKSPSSSRRRPKPSL